MTARILKVLPLIQWEQRGFDPLWRVNQYNLSLMSNEKVRIQSLVIRLFSSQGSNEDREGQEKNLERTLHPIFKILRVAPFAQHFEADDSIGVLSQPRPMMSGGRMMPPGVGFPTALQQSMSQGHHKSILCKSLQHEFPLRSAWRKQLLLSRCKKLTTNTALSTPPCCSKGTSRDISWLSLIHHLKGL